MPLGFQRLNERKQRPNANINFIKPLEGPNKDIAQDFLERIAAQCFPVMQKNHISVMALEEYAPNPEFLGRNFNAGEVIQLVLKDKGGRWLSFKFVQMVMMHELAHCKQMNHSRFFWAERNEYAKQMEELWARQYMGEGLWGRGQDLANGRFVHDHMPEQAQIPEHLCGGTYRRARGKKRKRGQDQEGEKSKETYAERQQKRIARRFGKHGEGNAVGEDDLVRGGLEHGKRHYGKPKVASSKRGRELRASAALARFEQAKKTIKEETPELGQDGDSETESDDWGSDGDAVSVTGSSSGKGRNDMVKVCGDEGEEDEGAQHEMDDLLFLRSRPIGDATLSKGAAAAIAPRPVVSNVTESVHEDSETESEPEPDPILPAKKALDGDEQIVDKRNPSLPRAAQPQTTKVSTLSRDDFDATGDSVIQASNATHSSIACPICSLENDLSSSTCLACSNVLKPSLMPNCWRCKTESCKGSTYVNAEDFGRCGLCGSQKPTANSSNSGGGRAMGVISSEVLRWD